MTELKPCPFCGGEAKQSGEKFERTILSWVYCTSCGAAGGYRGTEAEAIDAWNTRAERTCKEVLIDKHWRGCSACGYKWEFMYGIATCKRPNYCPNCGARVEKGGNDD